MIAENLISTAVLPLRTSDTGKLALASMERFNVRHLPIVNDRQLLGVVCEDDILIHNVQDAVGSYSLSLDRVFVHQDDHVYELMRLLAEHQLTIIPVVNHEREYLGMVSLADVLKYFARTAAFREPGSIVVLEFQQRSYSLSEVARLVEAEGASLLSAFVTSHPDDSLVEVTLKINRKDIQSIIHAFNRFGYVIKASFHGDEQLESLQDRLDALLSYLNV
ncbi:MAG: hypothetical protein RLY31_1761 [Bacteroidota bacterium]|jgi:CBS domain-containing protein